MHEFSCAAPEKESPGRKRGWKPVAWGILVLFNLSLLALHLLPTKPLWETMPLALTEIRQAPEYGPYAYSINMHSAWMNQTNTFQSPAMVLENGLHLAHANSMHRAIGDQGAGRFSFWGKWLIFSTSDNTDPRINGRTYALSRPSAIILAATIVSLMLLLAMTFWWRKELKRSVLQNRLFAASALLVQRPGFALWFSWTVVFVAFVVARLPWLIDIRIPGFQFDSATYFLCVKQMLAGELPKFDYRTPGYPLFLYLSVSIVPRIMVIVALQCLLTLASLLFFLYAVYRTCGRLVILASVAMVAHATQQLLTAHDFVLLTESLFTSFFLFFLGLFLIGTKNPRVSTLLSCAVIGGYAILIRPAGAFILGCILLGTLYLAVRKAGLAKILSLALPAPLMIIAFMAYNYYTVGIFELSKTGSYCKWTLTAPYWEPDPSFPAEINAQIKAFMSFVPEKDKEDLGTWDIYKIDHVFRKWAVNAATPPFKMIFSDDTPDYFKRIAEKAERSHPLYSLKRFYVTLYAFIQDASSYRINMYNDMDHFLTQMYVKEVTTSAADFIEPDITKFPHRDAFVVKDTPEGRRIVTVGSALRGKGIHDLLLAFNQSFFDHRLWTILYFLILFVSGVRLLQTRFQHWGTFALFTCSATLIGAAVVIAMATMMTNRYPSPTRFVEVLSLALLPLLSQKRTRQHNVLNPPRAE